VFSAVAPIVVVLVVVLASILNVVGNPRFASTEVENEDDDEDDSGMTRKPS
jgi:hypothetical protein